MIYQFEDFELDTDQLELRHKGIARAIEPQVFALLELLISNHHRIVSKEDLHQISGRGGSYRNLWSIAGSAPPDLFLTMMAAHNA